MISADTEYHLKIFNTHSRQTSQTTKREHSQLNKGHLSNANTNIRLRIILKISVKDNHVLGWWSVFQWQQTERDIKQLLSWSRSPSHHTHFFEKHLAYGFAHKKSLKHAYWPLDKECHENCHHLRVAWFGNWTVFRRCLLEDVLCSQPTQECTIPITAFFYI